MCFCQTKPGDMGLLLASFLTVVCEANKPFCLANIWKIYPPHHLHRQAASSGTHWHINKAMISHQFWLIICFCVLDVVETKYEAVTLDSHFYFSFYL